MKTYFFFLCLILSNIEILRASEHHDCFHSHQESSNFSFAKSTEPQENGLIFQEVTSISNIDYTGVSFGHAWADINKDEYPDLFCSGHGRPRLYMNNGDATFNEINFDFYKRYDTLGDGTIVPFRFFDLHGVSFTDVNHDGWPDMYVQMGGDMGNSEGKRNALFLNNNGQLVLENVSDQYGLRDSLGRGRSTVWVDLNHDDYLDAVLINFNRNEGDYITSVYQYNPQGQVFDNRTNLGLPNADYYGASLIRDPKGEKNLLITVASVGNGIQVLDTENLPFTSIVNSRLWGSRDVAVGDFDGDGIQDIFIVANQFASEAVLFDDTTLLIYLYAKNNAIHYEQENRVSFETDGIIRVESQVYPYMDEVKKYWRIGSGGYHPTENVFELDPTERKNQSINKGCLLCLGPFIGYAVNSNRWEIYQNDPIDNLRSAIKITSNNPIKNIKTHNFNNNSIYNADRLLLAQPNGNYTMKNNFLTNDNNLTSSVSVITADFDNDMDLDLILSCQGSAINNPNRYYENDGNGNFTLIHGFGAEGSKYGRSGAISYADFNNDGFMDVFLENGEGTLSVDAKPLHFNDGPYQLFMNKGNNNNWVKINLSDAASNGNKMAIGSVVHSYAGGKKQIRLKGAENHSFVQSEPVIHFGLGTNEIIDSLEITWPNGEVTKYYDLAVNKTYDISSRVTPIPTASKELNNTSFVIYPNPTNGVFRVEWSEIQHINQVKIYSMNGEEVYHQNIDKHTNHLQMNTHHQLKNGTYLLHITDSKGGISTEKFVVVH